MILDKFKIPNKIAIVTGAMGGNGFAIADALGEAGANLILTDVKAVSYTHLRAHET